MFLSDFQTVGFRIWKNAMKIAETVITGVTRSGFEILYESIW